MISVDHPAFGQHEDAEGDDPWNDRDFEEPCIAVVAQIPKNQSCSGIVLWHRGTSLEYEMEYIGSAMLEDLGLDDAPTGISVWEGRYVADPNYNPDVGGADTMPKGAFRPLTEEEWKAVREGRAPWEDE